MRRQSGRAGCRPIETLERRRHLSATLPTSTAHAIAYDKSSVLHAAYVDVTDGMLMYSRQTAGDWSIPVAVESVGTASAGGVSIGVGPTGQIDVAYYNWSQKQLKFAALTGGNWQVATVDPKGGSPIEPVLGFQKNGIPLIAYYNPVRGQLNAATPGKKAWSIAGTKAAAAVTPALAVNPVNHNLSAVFEDKLGRVHVGGIGKGGVGPSKVLDKPGSLKNELSLSFGPKAAPQVAYFDATNSQISLVSFGPKNRLLSSTVGSAHGVGPGVSLWTSPATGAVDVMYGDAATGGLYHASAASATGVFTTAGLDFDAVGGRFVSAAFGSSLTFAFGRTNSTDLAVSRTDITPLPPTQVAAAAGSAGEVRLSWNESSANVTGFVVYRSADGSTFTKLADVDRTARGFTDTGLSGQTYRYQIRAVGGDGSASLGVSSGGSTVVAVAAAALAQVVAGHVYVDPTNSGVYAAGRSGIATGLTLSGTDTSGNAVLLTTTSNASTGAFSFTGTPPGTYTVTEAAPAGYLPSKLNTTRSRGGVQLAAGGQVGDVDFGEIVPAQLTGVIYVDANSDGRRETTEPGIAAVTLTATGVDDIGQAVQAQAVTTSGGAYQFANLRPGLYSIAATLPSGYTGSENPTGVVANIAVGVGGSSTTNFGRVPPTVRFTGVVYSDANDDGARQSGEPGIGGVTISLDGTDTQGRAAHRTASTASDGSYQFANVPPGNYSLTMSAPTGYLAGIENQTGIAAAAASPMVNNFGRLLPASVGGVVFKDSDSDGVFDPSEPGLTGVAVTLTGTNDLGAAVTTTAATATDGRYSFPNLRPGSYQVREGTVTGFVPGTSIATAGTAGYRVVTNIPVGAGSTVTASFPETVPTRITVVPSTTLVAAGQSVGVSVVVASWVSSVPTGTVTIYDGATILGSATLDGSGHATFSTTNLPVGLHTITAVYNGDGVYTLITSAGIKGVVTPASHPTLSTLSATGTSATGIDLAWGGDGQNHSGFAVFRANAGTQPMVVATVAGTVHTFADRGLTQGVAYTYQVAAYDDGTTYNTATATTLLPAPAYLGPVVEPSYPSGFSTFNAPVSTAVLPGAGSPQVAEFTRTADPDTTIAVTAEALVNASLGNTVAGTGTGFLTFGQSTTGDATLADGSIQTTDGRAASVTLPASLPDGGLYFVWPKNTDATGTGRYAAPMVVNRPDLWWTGDGTATPGRIVSVYGRNLTHHVDGGQTGDTTWVYLLPDDGRPGQWVTATGGAAGSPDVNPYKVDFTFPLSLGAGTYTAWVNNGLDDHYGWSNSIRMTVGYVPATPRTVQVTSLTESAVEYAMATANPWFQVTNVQLPNGTIILDHPLSVPGYIHIVGSGSTVLKVPAGAGLRAAVDLGQQGFTGIENLQIIADDGALATAPFGDDGRGPGGILLGSVSQVIKNVTVSVVNPDTRSAPCISASSPPSGLRITDSTFTGLGVFLVGATDLVIDHCTFVGAGAGDASIDMLNGSNVSITRCTTRNLSDDPSLLYSSAARMFWLGSLGNRIYLGDNTTVNLFPEATLASGLNGGEQILTESPETAWEGPPVAGTASSVTLPASAGLPGAGWTVTVAGGTGIGQTRIVTAATVVGNSVVITIDSPWNVVPATDSQIAVQTTTDGFVVYNNHLSCDGVQSFNGSTTGVQIGGANIVIDHNTVSGTATGVALWSATKYSDQNASISDFAVITRNTISNVEYGLRSVTTSNASTEPAVVALGNVWRANTISNVHATPLGGDLPSGISISESIVAPDGQVSTNIFEQNVVNAPIGITFTPGGNQAPASLSGTTATLVRGNSFTSDGTPNRPAVLVTVTNPGFAAFVGNNYAGFPTWYSAPTSAAAPQLLAPSRSVSFTVAPNATASATVPIQQAAGTPVGWTVATDSLPVWLNVQPTTGTTGDESETDAVPLTVDATGLAAGTYTTTVRFLLAGVEAVDVVVTINVVA